MRLALAILTLLVFASPARAEDPVQRALGIAQNVWANPCVNDAKTVVLSPEEMYFGIDYPEGTQILGRGEYRTCTIYLNAEYVPGGGSYDWMTLCTVMIHEAGHLSQYQDPNNPSDPGHSADPASVMYSLFIKTDPRCETGAISFVHLPRLPRRKKLSQPAIPATISLARNRHRHFF